MPLQGSAILRHSEGSRNSSSTEELSERSKESLSALVEQQYSVGTVGGILNLRCRNLSSEDVVHLQAMWPSSMHVLNLVSALL
jgi:hypothetical protein